MRLVPVRRFFRRYVRFPRFRVEWRMYSRFGDHACGWGRCDVARVKPAFSSAWRSLYRVYKEERGARLGGTESYRPPALSMAELIPLHTAPKLNAKNFLVTYAQVNDTPGFNKDTLADFLNAKPFTSYIRVNREFHADDGTHWHAVVSFSRRYQGTIANCFDFCGKHPNIRVLRSRKHVLNAIEYVIKDGVEHLAERGIPPYTDEIERCTWLDILNESETCDDFMLAMERNFTKDFILRYFDILAFAQHRFNHPSDYVPQWPADSYVIPAAANQWLGDVLGEVRSRDCLSHTLLIA